MNGPDYEAELANAREEQRAFRRSGLSLAEFERQRNREYGGLPGDTPDPEHTDTFQVLSWDTDKLTRPEWLAMRRQGIGSSDAAPAMGMSPWHSAYSLWCEKRGLFTEDVDNERFLWGRLTEPLILDQAVERGWCQPGRRHIMVRCNERGWMLANPDMLTADTVVEAKTADSFDERRWDDGVPDHYVIQAHHLMAVCQRQHCLFPVLFGGHRLKRFDVDWSPILADMMLEAEAEFWQRVQDGNAPNPDGSESAMHAVRLRWEEAEPGKVIELPPEAPDRLKERTYEADLAKSHSQRENEIKAWVMEALGDAEVGTIGGKKAVTWKPTKAGKRVLRFVGSGGEG